MRGGAKNSVLKLPRSSLGLAPRSGYTFLVLSTGGVRTDVELGGFRTEGECPRASSGFNIYVTLP